MTPGILLIRADASAQIGWGHVMRCLALAQAWQDRGGECIFAMAGSVDALEQRLHSEDMHVRGITAVPGSAEDAQQTSELARQNNARWIVVDGYDFGAQYQRPLKQSGFKLLAIDDYGRAGNSFADLILDQNAGADESFYANRAPGTHLLLGTRYTMLRREFKAWRNWKREIPQIARKILITMGGSDPENVILRVVQALSLLGSDAIPATLVVSSNSRPSSRLQDLAEKSRGALQLVFDADNMPDLMALADLVISAAGSTCWETCMMGLPAIVVDIAANQTPVAQELARRQVVLHIPLEEATPEHIALAARSLITHAHLRASMSDRGRSLVDGLGSQRVVATIKAQGFSLRRATPDDCYLLWEWANDPEVRAQSFSSAPITWDEHTEWFNKKMLDKESAIFIAEDDNGMPVGQIRFDRTCHTEAELDISIANDQRRFGYAGSLIDMAAQRVFLDMKIERLCAWIKSENYASRKAFEKANFRKQAANIGTKHPGVLYVRQREARECGHC